MWHPYYDRDGNPITLDELAAIGWPENNHVRATAIDDECHVSTVWLGFNHQWWLEGPPLIFETMVFGGRLDEYQRRYPSEDAAIAGHDQVVAMVREAMGVLVDDGLSE